MLFDKDGMFRLDELMAERLTFRKIMEDNIVTDEEIEEQSCLVIELLKKIEETFLPEQLVQVENVLVEFGVLSAVYQYKQIQDLHF